jgi:ParB-like chromosome segregation protein Spo0J
MTASGDDFLSAGRTDRVSASRVEWVPIETLSPNPKNARRHSKKQIAQIAQSIRQFGFLNPAIVDDANRILAGHGRFEAARLEGLTDVPILRFSHLTEAEKRAYAIADNRIAEQARWDRQLLSVELGELIDLLPIEGVDISLTGFEIPEIDLLIAARAKSKSAPEDVAPQPLRHPVTRRGDLWLLGDHRLLCGDPRSVDDVGRLMDGALAAAAFCAPPDTPAGSAVQREVTEPPESKPDSAEMSPERYREFLLETLGNGARASAEGANHFVRVDWRRISDLVEVGRLLYGETLSLVVWDKMSAGPGSPYRAQHELIGVFRVGRELGHNNAESRRVGRHRSDIWTYPAPRTTGKNRTAPAADLARLPVALVADALLDCTAKGEIMLDLFAGSGATILAAEKVARRAYALEPEARFIDVAIQRWQQATKREAILADEGRGFATVAQSRASPKVAPRQLNVVGVAKTRANGEFDRESEVAADVEGGHD